MNIHDFICDRRILLQLHVILVFSRVLVESVRVELDLLELTAVTATQDSTEIKMESDAGVPVQMESRAASMESVLVELATLEMTAVSVRMGSLKIAELEIA